MTMISISKIKYVHDHKRVVDCSMPPEMRMSCANDPLREDEVDQEHDQYTR